MFPQEKSEVEPELPPALATARKDLQALVRSAAEVQRQHGLQVCVGKRVARERGARGRREGGEGGAGGGGKGQRPAGTGVECCPSAEGALSTGEIGERRISMQEKGRWRNREKEANAYKRRCASAEGARPTRER